MKRQRKKYETPAKPWDKNRIELERKIVTRFGLGSKKEIWRAEAIVRKFRRMARAISAAHDKENEKVLVEKMIRLGLLSEGAQLDDVLGLTLEKLLERRLQTLVKDRGLSHTIKQARQMITHGHVKINERRVTHPSYIVPRIEEGAITADTSAGKTAPAAEPKPETAEAKEGELTNG